MGKIPDLGGLICQVTVSKEVIVSGLLKEEYYLKNKKFSKENMSAYLHAHAQIDDVICALERYIGLYIESPLYTKTKANKYINKIITSAKRLHRAIHEQNVDVKNLEDSWNNFCHLVQRKQLPLRIQMQIESALQSKVPNKIIGHENLPPFIDLGISCMDIYPLSIERLINRSQSIECFSIKNYLTHQQLETLSRLSELSVTNDLYKDYDFLEKDIATLFLIKKLAPFWVDVTGRTYKETTNTSKKSNEINSHIHPFAQWLCSLIHTAHHAAYHRIKKRRNVRAPSNDIISENYITRLTKNINLP